MRPPEETPPSPPLVRVGMLEPGQVVLPYREFEPWQAVSAGPDPADPKAWIVRWKRLPAGEVREERMPGSYYIHGDWLPF